MKTRSLLLVGILAFAGLCVARTKTYDITLTSAAKVGSAMLPAGDYKLRVEGAEAVFTNEDNAKKFTAPVKIQNTAKKHEETAVQSTTQNGTQIIQAIELGGSPETLEFGE